MIFEVFINRMSLVMQIHFKVETVIQGYIVLELMSKSGNVDDVID
jgi:hypothetical protein